MKLKIHLLQLLILLLITAGHSQASKPTSSFWKQVRFGGGIGINFNNNSFNGSISPSALYQVNDKLGLGTSLNFNYAKFNNEKLLAYGGSVLTLINLIPEIQGSLEFEQLRINSTFETQASTIKENYWLPAFFVGLGYSTRNITFGMRYDLLYNNKTSIYGNALMPFVRIYF